MAERGGIIVGELFARQASDPAYQAMRMTRDRELAAIAKQRADEQRPILADLAAVGVNVDWVGHLCDMPDPDQRIYPVLLDHLGRDYSPWLLEWVGRALGRKSARPIVWDALVQLVQSHVIRGSALDGPMAAISQMARPSDIPTLIDLLSDAAIGSSRLFLIQNLMRSKRPKARAALLKHRHDPDLATEIGARLARA